MAFIKSFSAIVSYLRVKHHNDIPDVKNIVDNIFDFANLAAAAC